MTDYHLFYLILTSNYSVIFVFILMTMGLTVIYAQQRKEYLLKLMSIHKELFSLGWRVEEMNKNPKHEIHLAKLKKKQKYVFLASYIFFAISIGVLFMLTSSAKLTIIISSLLFCVLGVVYLSLKLETNDLHIDASKLNPLDTNVQTKIINKLKETIINMEKTRDSQSHQINETIQKAAKQLKENNTLTKHNLLKLLYFNEELYEDMVNYIRNTSNTNKALSTNDINSYSTVVEYIVNTMNRMNEIEEPIIIDKSKNKNLSELQETFELKETMFSIEKYLKPSKKSIKNAKENFLIYKMYINLFNSNFYIYERYTSVIYGLSLVGHTAYLPNDLLKKDIKYNDDIILSFVNAIEKALDK